MRPEEVRALVAENERLRAEVCALRHANAELREQVEALGGDLQAALARVGELERRKAQPPSLRCVGSYSRRRMS